VKEEKWSGAPGGSRTPNPQIRSLMLYPLSYGRSTAAAVWFLYREQERTVKPRRNQRLHFHPTGS
jgi:hypothetical protein